MFDSFFDNRWNYQPALWELIWPLPLAAMATLRIFPGPLIVAAAVFLAVLPLLTRWFVQNRPFRRTPLDGAWLLLTAGAVVGLWASYSFMVSLPAFLTLLVSLVIYYMIVHSHASVWDMVAVLVMSGSLVGVLYAGQVLKVIPATFFVPHPNAAAGFVEGLLLPALLLARHHTGPARWFFALITLALAAALLLTGSRGAWLGLFLALTVGSLIMAPSRYRHFGVIGLTGAVGLSAGVLLGINFLPAARQSSLLKTVFEGMDSRLALYRHSLNLLGDYPFTGIGLGDAFAHVYSRYQLLILPDYLFYAHNLYLSVALGYGVLGVAALAWLVVAFFRFVRRVEGAGSHPDRPMFRAAWLAVLAILIHGFMDSPHFSNFLWTTPMLFAIFGLAVAAGHSVLGLYADENDFEPEPLFIRRRSYLLPVIIAAAAVVGGIIFWRPLAAAWSVNMGALAHTRANLGWTDEKTRAALFTQAEYYFEKAQALAPENWRVNRRLGIIALDRADFAAALTYLQQAHRQNPADQSTMKALGLAYRAAGQPEQAAELLRQLNPASGITTGPNVWKY